MMPILDRLAAVDGPRTDTAPAVSGIRSPKRATGAGNNSRADWFRYYAGFSAAFVEDTIDHLDLNPGAILLDPWLGTGTTSEVAAAKGFQIRGYDLNPAMLLIARARLLATESTGDVSTLVLNTGEKLHAAKGRMKQLVFQKLGKHAFIKQTGIPMRRYAKETLCAQICINSFARAKLNSFARTRYDDLLHFFEEYESPQGKDLTLFNEESKKVSGVMDQLWTCFGNRTGDLKNRSYILSIYLFVEELIGKADTLSAGERKTLSKFVFDLWNRIKEESRLGMDRTNRELYSFQTFLSSAPGEVYQIERRHKKLSEFYAHFKRTGKIKGD